MKFKERKRKHDDAHMPLGGRGKKSISRKIKMFPGGKCSHPRIATGVVDRCCICNEVIPK